MSSLQRDMDPMRILKAAENTPTYLCDIIAVGRKAFPNVPVEVAIHNVAVFISGYTKMWHEVGNADPKTKDPKFSFNHPLYEDSTHQVMNPLVTEYDFLAVFKEYERIQAVSQNTGSMDKNWEAGQDRLAEIVCGRIFCADKVPEHPTV
jgi:hypothetical protein